MDEALRRLVEQVHAAHTMAVIVVTGAGSQAVAWVLGVPGASRTVLEVLIPYGRRSLMEFLGYEPEQYVSAETARALAARAYRRAQILREAEIPVVGLGCTATIITDRPKRGEHRAHIAAQTAAGTTTYSLALTKGLRDREGKRRSSAVWYCAPWPKPVAWRRRLICNSSLPTPWRSRTMTPFSACCWER